MPKKATSHNYTSLFRSLLFYYITLFRKSHPIEDICHRKRSHTYIILLLLKILVKCFRAGAVIYCERKYNIYEQEIYEKRGDVQ